MLIVFVDIFVCFYSIIILSNVMLSQCLGSKKILRQNSPHNLQKHAFKDGVMAVGNNLSC